MNWNVRLGLAVITFCLPSALFVWLNSDVPMFCSSHDDCLYFVSAKSLAQQGEYRIESLPGEPYQTKYPPLYPLLLSIAWRMNPQFPANLTPAVWISWLALPAMLYLMGLLLREMGAGGRGLWLSIALVAVNPYTLHFSSMLLSETVFTALLLGALLLTERAAANGKPVWLAAAGGVAMGFAYLARTAAIAALPAVVLFFVLRKQPRKGFWFAAGMLPCVAGWTYWTQAHRTVVTDPAWMYYLDYIGYQFLNVPLKDLPLVAWKNIDSTLWAMAALVVPKASKSILLKIFSQVIAVAMISGSVRMIRRSGWSAYAAYGAGSLVILTLWHFPPDERFVYPLFPLALTGLFVELKHLYGILKAVLLNPEHPQRTAARFIAATVGTVLCFCMALQVLMNTVYLPVTYGEHRAKRVAQSPALRWIREGTPESAVVLAVRDPMVYLSTGRHSLSRQILTTHWYHQDREAVVDTFRTADTFARKNGAEYLYYADRDFGWAIDDEDFERIGEALEKNRELETVFREKDIFVYKVPPSDPLANSPHRTPDNPINNSARQHNR